MKIELTTTEMKVLIDLIKDGATFNEIKKVVDTKPELQNEVKIGEQIWSKHNLKVNRFRNGEPIPLVRNKEEWCKLKTAAYCISPSGSYLYNWYAVNDKRGLAPEGWHVPSDDEWTKLTDYLGGEEIAGANMKSSAPIWNGNNWSGFTALAAGYHSIIGNFGDAGNGGFWWSSSPHNNYAWNRRLSSNSDRAYRNYNDLRYGFSVRCIKD